MSGLVKSDFMTADFDFVGGQFLSKQGSLLGRVSSLSALPSASKAGDWVFVNDVSDYASFASVSIHPEFSAFTSDMTDNVLRYDGSAWQVVFGVRPEPTQIQSI